MIVPMKKVTIVCLLRDKDVTLQRLQELGVLHVVPLDTQRGEGSEAAEQAVKSTRRAMAILQALDASSHQAACDAEDENVDAFIEKIETLHSRRTHLEDQLQTLRHTRQGQAPFGDFDPDTVTSLAKRGIVVKLYHVRDRNQLDVPSDVQIQTLSSHRKSVAIAAIGKGDFSLNATHVPMPRQSLSALDETIEASQKELAQINRDLLAMTSRLPFLETVLEERVALAEFARVHDGLGRHERIVFLNGFVPADTVSVLRDTAKETGWGLKIEEPSQEDVVPTLLRFPKWVQPIKTVLQMLAILPGYRESDISSVFLIFFSVFFAILIGDAGYGFLFLTVTLITRAKFPKAPAYPFVLFGILSFCTIVWGTLSGNYFGLQPELLPAPLRRMQIAWLMGEAAQQNVINLCFLIGATHLTIAHIWNAVAFAPSLKALAEVGRIGLVWSMYLTAASMVLDHAFPPFFLPLFIASLLLILLFMTSPAELKRDWIHHAMLPLSIVNCFVDVVSYIRLFAVGMASLAVAQSFNDMAAGLGWDRVWTVPLAALILLLGHGLNIILCALGILVHGVRLNTLEFSLHKNIEWKGVPYRPFAGLKRDLPPVA